MEKIELSVVPVCNASILMRAQSQRGLRSVDPCIRNRSGPRQLDNPTRD